MARAKIVLISTDECIKGLGVRTLSSCLIEAGFDTRVVLMPDPKENYKNIYWDDLEDVCRDALLVGISCMTHGLQKAIEIKRTIEKKISAPFVIGGIHASLDPESLFNNFELVCHGEGEDLIVELAKRLSNNAPYSDLPGLWVKQDGKIVRNKNQPLRRDLNLYPFPDYNLSRHFILERRHLIPLRRIPGHIAYKHFVILGSRGCPHHCTYCCNQSIKDEFPWRKHVRHYSVTYIINHLKEVCGLFPELQSFWIGDDTFFAKKPDEIKEFAKKFKDQINKPFLILVSPWTFDEDKVRLLFDAGMSEIIMGIQSGSEDVNRNIYDRQISNQRIIEIVQFLNKYSDRVLTYYDFIGMNPFEKEEDLIDTIRLIRNFPAPFLIFNNNLAFYPGTKLYAQARKRGLDVSRRVKHAESSIGYSILKNENIQHKLFHFILLLMAGDTDSFKIGYVPRFMISDSFIAFYSFLNQKLKLMINPIVSIISSLIICPPLVKIRIIFRHKIIR